MPYGSNAGNRVTNLDLPIHLDMLDISNKTGVVIKSDEGGNPLSVSTAYVVLELGKEGENISPVYHTRPAANIIFLGRDNDSDGIFLGLVRRRRPDRGTGRPATEVTKACGGYFHDGSTGDLASFVEMIRRYVGLKVKVEDLYLCGNEASGYISDPGHGAILTPIAFTYATKWEEDPSVTPKMEFIRVSLEEAEQMCFDTLNNAVSANRIEDTSSIFAILNAIHLIKTGQIMIPTNRNINLPGL